MCKKKKEPSVCRPFSRKKMKQPRAIVSEDTIENSVRIIKYLEENLTKDVHNHRRGNDKTLERDLRKKIEGQTYFVYELKCSEEENSLKTDHKTSKLRLIKQCFVLLCFALQFSCPILKFIASCKWLKEACFLEGKQTGRASTMQHGILLYKTLVIKAVCYSH